MGALRIAVVCLLSLVTSQAAEYEVVCEKQLNECACQLKNGGMIDICKLDNHNPFTPTFMDKGKDGFTYQYNPLTPFHKPPSVQGCFGVAVCQCLSETEVYSAGNHVYARFQTDWKGLYIEYYTFPDNPGEVFRTSRVYLICDHGQEKFEAIGETGNTTGVYEMHLWSRYACANQTSPAKGDKPDIYRMAEPYHRPVTSYIWDICHLIFAFGVLGLVIAVHKSLNRKEKGEQLLTVTPTSDDSD